MKTATGTIVKLNGKLAVTLPEATYFIANPGLVARMCLYVGDNAEFQYHPQDQYATILQRG